MNNKIVILDNSVELYEHYIDDAKWERTLAFPRGGVTYLVSNGTIKFYAYEDYLYRNCLISMQLPIRVVDENEHIDDDYEDIDELAEVLDRIFPTNDIDAELDGYLRIKDADLLYQPKGDYILRSEVPDLNSFVTDEELVDALEDYYTKDETSGKTEIQDALDLKADKSDTYTKAEVDNKTNGKADANDVYTKQECDSKFQLKGNYVSANTFISYTATTNAALANKADKNELPNMSLYYTKDETSGKTEIQDALDLKADKSDTYTKDEVDEKIGEGGQFDPNRYYTKVESDSKYQTKGSYVPTSTYNSYTATTNTNISNLQDNKLDITAYTPSDLSNYYTKSEVYNKNEVYTKNEVDDKITSAGTFDPTRYYTKDASDDRFALKNEIPSVSGFATEEWVINKNYATRANFITYINNMQQQINSLIEAVSGCCETQEDVYRWLTLIGDNDYICENNNKYEKQQYQVSHDGGIVWENVVPTQYQKGELLESDSEDCGYVPDPQYRWKAAPTSDYMCSGTSKYYKVYYEVSYDGGQTWQHVVPEQTKRGNLIETNSTDCGYIAPQYRWYTSQQEYICSGTTKYQKQYYQVSTDGGQTWSNVTPVQTRSGSVIAYNSTDCGYIAPQYRWYTAPNTDYICSGTTKYQKQYYQVSTDGGQTWSNVSPQQTRRGNVIETDSTDCGYVPPTPKFVLTLNDSSTVSAACDSTGTINQNETEGYEQTAVIAEIKNCVTKIDKWAFYAYHSLTSVTIPNTVTSIGYYGFGYCDKLTSVTLPNSLIEIGDDAFNHCSGLTSVVIPNSVTTIGGTAFYFCEGLTSVTFGNSVTTIGGSAFNGCESLTAITLPSSVTSLGTGAFNQCHGLRTVTCRATTPPTMGMAVFDDDYMLTAIYVPSGSVNAYKAADGWSKYASIIRAI